MRKGRKLKVAAIMDEFTYQCYMPECDLMQITPDNFREEIDGFNPDFLFIESVWRGKDNLWRFKLHDNMEAIIALTSYCKEKKIPVVFWSKEDPVHFGVFIRTAALADFVFTTDADCIELYKAHLGHNNVFYLPFAAQPLHHNPIEEYKRQDKFCFAGSFYVKYQERSRIFMDLSEMLMEHGLDIYDRNFKKGDSDNNKQTTSVASPLVENYYYPEKLQSCILGGLPYSEISKAYKGYKYGVNMTSMVHSGFMFARRVFELLACNTVTVSNYSRGLELFFGDLIIATDNPKHMKEKLERYCGTDLDYRKYRLAGLRHVLKSHLYEDRLNLISEKVLGKTIKKELPKILVVCKSENPHVRQMFENQSYEKKQLLIAKKGQSLQEMDYDYITFFSESDYYGKNYLLDFALATRFADDDVIGKVSFYSKDGLAGQDKTYIRVKEKINLRRQMIKRTKIDSSVLADMIETYNPELQILSLDEFNYFENGKNKEIADDIKINAGIDLEAIYQYTDQIKPVILNKDKKIPLKELYEEVQVEETDLVDKNYIDEKLVLERDVEDDEIVWLRTKKNYQLSEFTIGSRIGFFTEVKEKIGNVRCQIEYYDENDKKLGFLNFALDGFTLLRIHDNAKSFKLIFRMRGKSKVVLSSIYTSSPNSVLPAPFPLRERLLITEEYPSYMENEKSSDIHEFVKENEMEVIKLGKNPSYLPFSEYEDVQILSTQFDALKEYLNVGIFKTIYLNGVSEKTKILLKNYQGEIIEI